ncbi:helix-turn-helix transcriptional regulator [Haloarchaeobius amylolyticus]|uniref:helix-turn-helix transcriptional regulator n=1 Tax=Haloarchaeobius amylolyticus TaxID=1198296 RepID=UPI00226E3010|nr:hypothetical protein [Haloarchaeobius amylolyticus]
MSSPSPTNGETTVDHVILWLHAALVGARDRATSAVARLRDETRRRFQRMRPSAVDDEPATEPVAEQPDAPPSADVVEAEATIPACPSDQILAAVEREGGRMWQNDIVESVNCSSSTVSRHLCALESEGAIQRVTVGREKIVALPDYEFDATMTMHDDKDPHQQAA